MSKWGRKAKKPEGFEYLEPTLDALEEELRSRTNESHEGKSKAESLWPIHQINWQRTRYVYDMYYKYNRISREVYQYCLDQKYADAALIGKWKKPGYERVCSTFVVNPKNFPYGTVSICRVPKQFLKDKGPIKSNFTGCLGCASGKAGVKNIFGNKYGQKLAKIQILREQREKMNLKKILPEGSSESNSELGNDVSHSTVAEADHEPVSAWYDEQEDIDYSDGSSTEDDEEVNTNARSKRKASEVSAAEVEATLNLAEKKPKQ